LLACGVTTPANLTLAGNTGSVVQWERANNPAFTGATILPYTTTTLLGSNMGVIPPAPAIVYYRAVIQTASCPIIYSTTVTVAYDSTTWTGLGWVPSLPTATKAVFFAGNYSSTGDINACSVTVQSGAVVFNANHNLIVENAVTVSGGSLTFNNNSSLVQVSNAVNTGNITYIRNSTLMRRFDFTNWSSPVSPQTLVNLSPLTLSDKYYTMNTTIGNWQSIASSNLMVPGSGYLIRAPQTFNPLSTTVYNGSFIGVPNNGDISTNVIVGVNTINSLGNPYPSAIDIDLFLTDPFNSTKVEGAIYLWTHN
jgi:hypothetical protein